MVVSRKKSRVLRSSKVKADGSATARFAFVFEGGAASDPLAAGAAVLPFSWGFTGTDFLRRRFSSATSASSVSTRRSRSECVSVKLDGVSPLASPLICAFNEFTHNGSVATMHKRTVKAVIRRNKLRSRVRFFVLLRMVVPSWRGSLQRTALYFVEPARQTRERTKRASGLFRSCKEEVTRRNASFGAATRPRGLSLLREYRIRTAGSVR